MKKKVLKIVSVLVALVMSLSAFVFAAEVDYEYKLNEALAIYRNFGLFSDDDTDYVKEALIEMFEESPELFYTLVNKIYERDDRYSHYMSPEEYEESYVMESSMVGIGVVITNLGDKYLTVDSVSDGPAKRAGILAGDKLIKANDISLENFSPTEAAEIIRGEAGTKVKLTVLRGEEELTFYVTREKIIISDVTAEIIDEKVGYIKLANFSGIHAFIDFMEAYDDFEEAGVNTIVLDLRDNRGGSLDCLINLMDNILPEQGIPYLMSWQSKPLKVNIYQSEGYGWEFNKFVILVNENSASASEIMAGSMRDLGYATIVGETTFGKGMGQNHIKTSDGDEAIITSLELKLPTSGGYDEIGIVPDHKVSKTLRKFTLPYLTPLVKHSPISKIKTQNVKAVEERLEALGYFTGEPDNNWDNDTVRAINFFCRAYKLPTITSICSWETIEKIDKEARNLENKYYIEDTQLEVAIRLAKEYSKSDEKAKCIDINEIDFRR